MLCAYLSLLQLVPCSVSSAWSLWDLRHQEVMPCGLSLSHHHLMPTQATLLQHRLQHHMCCSCSSLWSGHVSGGSLGLRPCSWGSPASTAGLEAALCKFTAVSMTKYYNMARQKLQSVRLLRSHGSHWIAWEQSETALSLPKITPRLSCSLSWLSCPIYIQNACKCINTLVQYMSMKEKGTWHQQNGMSRCLC